MYNKLAFCSVYLLLILLDAYGSSAQEMAGETQKMHLDNDRFNNQKMDVLRLHSMDKQENDAHEEMHVHHMHTHSSSHMDHMDPSVLVFFQLDDLKQGNSMPIHFPRRKPNSSPRLLSKQEADSIPFQLQKLPNLLELFSFSQDSPQAQAMENTLRECETEPIKGETKFCATSLESMLDFIQKIIGMESQIKVLSTTHLTNSKTLLQKFTIMKIQEISAPKSVACHTMPYPYTIFYCHYQESISRVFRVSLAGEYRDKSEAIAVCHLDTSQWSENHVAFRVLGIKPGSSPVCHFFPADNFLWVPSTTTTTNAKASI
ncbi:BURP domain-containing protein BNM2A-like [Olea europaea var. sylvestris]|uniref:BURP domain-containing protein BNM2A-like n=1 Tax=Olea europaea var. sylvestris TaxID=158386 RepID=UPI000C1D466A|nr:BURP domain-containing protein BNM2A-like [Olea europaea var. sylvestris]